MYMYWLKLQSAEAGFYGLDTNQIFGFPRPCNFDITSVTILSHVLASVSLQSLECTLKLSLCGSYQSSPTSNIIVIK
mgnify:CR=1 FL=1